MAAKGKGAKAKAPAAPATFAKKELKALYDKRLEEHTRAKSDLKELVERLIKDLGHDEDLRPVPFVQANVKEFDSFYAKAKRKRNEGKVTDAASCFNVIRDVSRARIICQTLSDVQKLGRILDTPNDKFHVGSSQPEIHGPSSNPRGYRSVHYDLIVQVQIGPELLSVPCELQVCTTLQFAWNLFTHGDVYKKPGVDPFYGEVMRDVSEVLFVTDTLAERVIRQLEQTAAP